MLGLGASLTVDDFLRVVKNPKDFFIGFICQLIVLPIVAYLLIITISKFCKNIGGYTPWSCRY
ncbi:MAG: hypothetical protein P8I89_05605 [Alphaproteobacteria bacterium]|nr:hypothetical protein [Alphaproteobacteria bacterium]